MPSYSGLKAAIFGKKNVKAEDEEEDKKTPANDKENGKKGKKSRKADDDEPGMSEGEEDDREEEKDSDEGESEEESDSEQEEEEDKKNRKNDNARKSKKSEKSSAAAQERSRIQAIMAAGADNNQIELATDLALNTDMSVDSATALIRRLPAASSQKKSKIDERMASVKNPNVGADSSENATRSAGGVTEKSLAAMTAAQRADLIIQAGELRRGEIASLKLPAA